MTQEKIFKPMAGWLMLFVGVLLVLGFIPLIIHAANGAGVTYAIPAAVSMLAGVLCLTGLFIVQPNDARVLTLFGSYVGSVTLNGFWWVNPFCLKRPVSLRARNLNGQKLKVNDKNGNPIEISAVIVWEVRDTARALFDVNDYLQYVEIQSEGAVRHLASSYPYDVPDQGADSEVSLRGNPDEVAALLEGELISRLELAGVHVIEARLSNLFYAPEIAEAMLRRQQAAAIVAARALLVQGAVGMVQMALEKLSAEHVVELDEERKAAMVSNLLVVLCGDHSATPVINAGTLHN